VKKLITKLQQFSLVKLMKNLYKVVALMMLAKVKIHKMMSNLHLILVKLIQIQKLLIKLQRKVRKMNQLHQINKTLQMMLMTFKLIQRNRNSHNLFLRYLELKDLNLRKVSMSWTTTTQLIYLPTSKKIKQEP
jgi:hypothetical protein